MSLRLGVDVGGTFTDVVLQDVVTGDVRVGKHISERSAGALADATAVDGDFDKVDVFLHATTVAINTLLQRSGAVLGMLTTRGFRDALELRRGTRHDARGHRMYDLVWKAPPPLVPRALRRPVLERIAADGSVVTPVDEGDVKAAAQAFQAADVGCVAIAFFNAHANPVNELRAAESLRAAGYRGEISLSHVLSREVGEYERASTTAVDAYVRPVVASYLRELESELQSRGMAGRCLITRSGGGNMTFAEAAGRPYETIMSGPAAGAIGAGSVARSHGLEKAIAADVGGTSFDTCLIAGGSPPLLYETDVLGMPVQAPWIDIRSIGAGGGSIARADSGLLRVGPRSAGVDPGPACYGRGGDRPTVTDAAATLGMLGGDRLAGGLVLDRDRARQALAQLGAELGLDSEATARGVIAVTAAAMSAAIRSVTVEVGEDPREMPLIAYGGAGPLFACLLVRQLELRSALIPRDAGSFSAHGLLVQEPTRTASQSLGMPLSPDAIGDCARVLGELYDRLDGADGDLIREARADLRYAGQAHALTLDLHGPGGDAVALRQAFDTAYERRYGYRLDAPVELVTVRATVRMPVPGVKRATGAPPAAQTPEELPAFSFEANEEVMFSVVERAGLAAGDVVPGPAVIREPTATTYVDQGFAATALPDLVLHLAEDDR